MQEEFPRINRLPKYVFAITNDLKERAKAQGEDIIDFGMGNPDQPPPKHIIDKLIQTAKKDNAHRYSMSRGIPGLRKAITNWYKRRYDVDLNYETEAIITLGSKEGLANLAQAIIGRGDTVLVPNPAYPIHPYGFVIAGADIISVPCGPGYDFFLELEKSITNTWPKPKAIVINYPSNPTAECVDIDFFKKIIKICKKYKIWAIQDLAYADIVYDGYKAPSILQVSNAKDIAVEFFSLSKSYNMPGWRVGFMVGNNKLVAALSKIKSYLDYGIFNPIQVAAIEALEGDQQCVLDIRDMYKKRRDILCQELNNIGWKINPPKATMFVWAKIPDFYLHMGSLKFCKELIKKAKVGVSPGIGFGNYGDEYIRISLIENTQRIKQAAINIRKMFKEDGVL